MENIVIGMSEAPAAAAAVRWVVEESHVRGWPVTAVLCWSYPGRHGVGPVEAPPDGLDRPTSAALDDMLAAALGDRAGEVSQRVAEVAFAVAGLLHHVDVGDLLVLGPLSRSLAHGLLRGSITQRCLREAPCPIAVVHGPPDPVPPRRVVVGLDGSDASRAALRWALDEGRARDVPVQLLHAWQVPILASPRPPDPRDAAFRHDAQAALDRMVAALPGSARGVDIEPVLVEGPATDVLLDCSDQGDLVVVGTTGISGVAGLLLGSTAHRLSQLAPSPVVLVPAPL